MTSQTESTDFDMKLVDLLQKKFSEEKKAHGETTLQLLSSQAQAQVAEAEATKGQELVAEITSKLDQAREEIQGLRVQAQEAQTQAQDAQTKIKDLEAQIAQMRLSEQSQVKSAMEAQEEVRSLRAQTQELETARAKIVNLEARMVKARAFFAEIEVETISEPIDQIQELKAAQVKIESLEVQVAQIKLFEQFQVQAEELKAALAKITELEAQMAQSEKQGQEKIDLLNSEIRDLRAQTQELHESHVNTQKVQTQELEAAQAQVKDLRSQVAKAKGELRETQNKLLFLGSACSKPKAPVRIPIRTKGSEPPNRLKNYTHLSFDNLTVNPAHWFSPEHLQHFSGTRLELSRSPLRADHMAQFLDSWLSGSHPYLETVIVNDFTDFLSQPKTFDKFASSLVREYGDDVWNRTSTFHLERPSDGRIACVKITGYRFIFIV